jgi:hypothetical protein
MPANACRPLLPFRASAQNIARHYRQADRVVEFVIRREPGIGNDDRTAKLDHQAAVEVEPLDPVVWFTRRVRRTGGSEVKVSI